MGYMLQVDIAGQEVLIPADQVQAVVRPGYIEPVPGVAPDIIGIMTLRGRVLTVIDPAVRLGGSVGSLHEAVAVVVRWGEHGYALLCDRAAEVREVDDADLAPSPSGFSLTWQSVSLGTAQVGMRRLAVFSPGRFLTLFELGQTAGSPA